MGDVSQTHADVPAIRKVAAGEDLFGEALVAAGTLAFKVVPPDPNGLLIFEMTLTQKGGLREIAKASGPAPQEPDFWRAYDLELVGPPLAID